MNQATDETLLKQYANGDFAAFEQLYTRNKGGLFRYLLRQVHNKALVEDIFQEVWGKVVSNAATFQESATFKTWLYTIARNKVIDHVRHLKVVNQVMEHPFRNTPNTDALNNNVSNNDDYNNAQDTMSALADSYGSLTQAPDTLHNSMRNAQAIEHCLEKLPKHQLDCFLLREEAGMTANAIAEVMSLTLEAAKSRVKTSYKNLRACLSLKLDLAIDATASQAHGRDTGAAKEITNE